MTTKVVMYDGSDFVIVDNLSINVTIDYSNITADSDGKKIIYAGDPLGFAANPLTNRSSKARIAVLDTLTLNSTNANSDFKVTATNLWTGAGLAVELIDPSANDAVLGYTFLDNVLTVNLATGGAGAITSTANDIIAMINGDAELATMMTAALVTGSTGVGVVEALASAPLASGYRCYGYAKNTIDVTDGDDAVAMLVEGVVKYTSVDTVYDMDKITFLKVLN